MARVQNETSGMRTGISSTRHVVLATALGEFDLPFAGVEWGSMNVCSERHLLATQGSRPMLV